MKRTSGAPKWRRQSNERGPPARLNGAGNPTKNKTKIKKNEKKREEMGEEDQIARESTEKITTTRSGRVITGLNRYNRTINTYTWCGGNLGNHAIVIKFGKGDSA